MNTFFSLHVTGRNPHGICLSIIVATFFGLNYLIFAEVGPALGWNLSFYGLYGCMLVGFGVSWIYAGAIHKQFKKIQALVSETATAEALLQAKLKTLSRKEQEVLKLILARKTNQQICDTLFISLSTLKTHINHIFKKLEVSTRQEILSTLK